MRGLIADVSKNRSAAGGETAARTRGGKPRKGLFGLLALTVAAVLLLATFGAIELFAAPDASTAVHVNPDDIEQSTLAIGTHLIHLTALTESIYDIAVASAQTSNQNGSYYKSELADGAWFDITAATALRDITTLGTPVQTANIGALWFTHHTKSDGITYDLLTGQAVNPFDIDKPYELRLLDELMPLDIQYQLLQETQRDSGQGQQKLARLDGFWATQVRNAATS
jgi:hypothetical protein